MDLHRLAFQAIGPFPTHEVINFDELRRNNPVFLIQGRTGSGKSTILDAISFALYGNVLKIGSDKNRIRSNWANNQTISQVDLTFSLNSGTYRVIREPEYIRPKRNSTELTIHKAKAVLYKINSQDLPALHAESNIQLEPLCAKVSEVNIRLRELIGLDHNQFAQTIFLPQGEFAKFLAAKSEDRKDILEKIFRTHLFSTLEKKLGDRHKTQNEMVLQKQQILRDAYLEISSRFTSLPETANSYQEFRSQVTDLQNVKTCQIHIKSYQSFFKSLHTHLNTEIEQIQTRITKLTKRQQQEQKKIAQIQDLNQRVSEYRELHSQLQNLDLQKDAYNSAYNAIQQHEKAQTVWNSWEDIKPVCNEIKNYQSKINQLLEQINSSNFNTGLSKFAKHEKISILIDPVNLNETPETKLPSYQKLYENLSLQQNKTNKLILESSNLHKKIADLKESLSIISKFSLQLSELKSKHKKISAKLQTARVQLSQFKNLEDTQDTKIENLNLARIHLHTCQQDNLEAQNQQELIKSTTKKLSKAKNDKNKISQILAEKIAHEARITQQWHMELAAVLAADLQDGSPCLVCGSKTHPNPAHANGSTNYRELKEAASQATRDADIAYQQHLSTLKSLKETLKDLESNWFLKRFDDAAHKLQQAEKKLKTQENEYNQLIKDINTKTALQNEINELDKEEKILAFKISASVESKNHAQKTLNLLAQELSKLINTHAQMLDNPLSLDLLKHLKEHPNLTLLNEISTLLPTQTEIEIVADLQTQILSLIQQLQALQIPYQQGIKKYLDIAKTYKYTQLCTVKQDLLTDDLITSYRQLTDNWEQQQHVLSSQLTSSRYQDLENKQISPLDTLNKKLDKLNGEIQLLSFDITITQQHLTHLKTSNSQIQEAQRSLKIALQDLEPISRLAIIARNAHGNERIPLSTFALLKHFQEVITAANLHLAPMSQERYLLQHDPFATTGSTRGKHGLGLKVIDTTLSTTRSTTSLSGGESFYVSLALALGIAQVVRAHAGGVQMGTLFIDEGFGSLDPQTLDGVMAQLNKQTAQGRLLGIISHVENLKNYVHNVIQVKPNQNGKAGSTLKINYRN